MTDAAFIRILEEGGLTRPAAEAIAEAVRARVSDGVTSASGLAEVRNDVLWIKRIGGVLVALGIAATGFLYSEIGSVREGVGENRAAISELAKGQARIEAILEERLPRDR